MTHGSPRGGFWTASVRVASFVLGAALVTATTEYALDLSQLEPVGTGVGLIQDMRSWRVGMDADQTHARVAFIGDSKLLGAPNKKWLPETTQQALRHVSPHGSNLKIHAMAWPALGIAGCYSIADEVIRAHPDRVVLEVNLQLFGPEAPTGGGFPELSGLISGSRLWQATWLPLSYTGITLNRMLFYRLLILSHLESYWVSFVERQGRIFKLRDPVEHWLEFGTAHPGAAAIATRWQWPLISVRIRRLLLPGKLRDTDEHARATLGNLLDGLDPAQPRLRVLDALLEDYRRAGIPTLVWVTPLNLDHLHALGFATDGVERSVAVLRALTEKDGATFLDLHAGLPDDAFLDSGDHFTCDGKLNATRIVATKLATAIVDMGAK